MTSAKPLVRPSCIYGGILETFIHSRFTPNLFIFISLVRISFHQKLFSMNPSIKMIIIIENVIYKDRYRFKIDNRFTQQLIICLGG